MSGRLGLVGAGLVFLAMVAGAQVAVAQLSASTEGKGISGYGPYTPPPCVAGVPFADVTCSTFYDGWIEQFARDGITAGCGGGNYCPNENVTRAQMAVFIEAAMRGTSDWPAHTQFVWAVKAADGSPDPVASGTALLNAVAGIPTSGNDAPSGTNPWLVKVGPGIYDLGSGSLTLPAYTALEGAGQNVTVITAAGYASVSGATVILGDHDSLSRLTVSNTGGNSYETAIRLTDTIANNVVIDHVRLTASNSSNASGSTKCLLAELATSFTMSECDLTSHGAHDNTGLTASRAVLDGVRVTVYGSDPSGSSYGYSGHAAPAAITDSRFDVSDGATIYGIAQWQAPIDVQNSEIHTSGPGAGVYLYDGSVMLAGTLIISQGYGVSLNGPGQADISSCRIEGASGWIANNDPLLVFTTTVGGSKLVGPTTGSGTTVCFGNYTDTGFLPDTCP